MTGDAADPVHAFASRPDAAPSRGDPGGDPGSRAPPGLAFAEKLMAPLAIPLFALDARGRVMIWNRACERLTGFAASELLGGDGPWTAARERGRRGLGDFLASSRRSDANAAEGWSRFEVHAQGISAEAWCEMPRAGRRAYLAFDLAPILDERGRLSAAVGTIRDLTDSRRMEADLSALAHRDALTALANRRAFDHGFAEAWGAGGAAREASLILIDVDRMKLCNDSFGHAEGDRRLRRVAAAIRRETRRRGDLAARIGGDEFAANPARRADRGGARGPRAHPAGARASGPPGERAVGDGARRHRHEEGPRLAAALRNAVAGPSRPRSMRSSVEPHLRHVALDDQLRAGRLDDVLDRDARAALLQHEARLGRLDHRHLGDDQAHAARRGQRQRAARDDLVARPWRCGPWRR